MKLVQITEKTNVNQSICGPCGGRCCKYQPGITHPAQWGATPMEMEASLTIAFATGRWGIDWWEGDVNPKGDLESVYFVRPHAVGYDKTRLFHGASYNRRCNFLTDVGCELSPEGRPDGCLHLVPSKDRKCLPPEHKNDKETYAKAWRPYQDVILRAAAAVGASEDDREVDELTPWWGLR
jgi:hypothetical protein